MGLFIIRFDYQFSNIVVLYTTIYLSKLEIINKTCLIPKYLKNKTI